MVQSEIEGRAAFDRIRYAQVWEDADVLTQALGEVAGKTLVSICSAGDNALAMLTLDPERIVVVDLSPAQIMCLRLRIGAYRALSHEEFLELTGSRASNRRRALLGRALAETDHATTVFWAALEAEVAAHGIGGVGKFERYFRLFRNWLLPLVYSRRTIEEIFEPRTRSDREVFFRTRLDTWCWRLVRALFFSRAVMGRLGRDRAFFDHVEGSMSGHVAGRMRHVGIETDPSRNPYLHWIMTGAHGNALPMAWRAENYPVIRDRLDRLDIREGSIETFLETGETADGFNLSDIFEYMSPDVFAEVYGALLTAARPGARLIYWNMLAPRRVPTQFGNRITTRTDLEDRLKAQDMAFFYSDFVVEEVVGPGAGAR